MYKEDRFVNEEFIPWPDYAICPNCNEKIDLPKDWNIFRHRSKKEELLCPNCNTFIDYIKPGKFIGPPYTIE